MREKSSSLLSYVSQVPEHPLKALAPIEFSHAAHPCLVSDQQYIVYNKSHLSDDFHLKLFYALACYVSSPSFASTTLLYDYSHLIIQRPSRESI